MISEWGVTPPLPQQGGSKNQVGSCPTTISEWGVTPLLKQGGSNKKVCFSMILNNNNKNNNLPPQVKRGQDTPFPFQKLRREKLSMKPISPFKDFAPLAVFRRRSLNNVLVPSGASCPATTSAQWSSPRSLTRGLGTRFYCILAGPPPPPPPPLQTRRPTARRRCWG